MKNAMRPDSSNETLRSPEYSKMRSSSSCTAVGTVATALSASARSNEVTGVVPALTRKVESPQLSMRTVSPGRFSTTPVRVISNKLFSFRSFELVHRGLLDTAQGEPADDVLLAEEEHEDYGKGRKQGTR